MSADDVQPGQTWAEKVRGDGELTAVVVDKVCGPSSGCGDSWRGAHVHVATLPGRRRRRTVAASRFRSGGPYTVDRVRQFGARGGYYRLEVAERAEGGDQ